ncbi:fas-binding factor 1 isoform X5 [Pogona vitticeps]
MAVKPKKGLRSSIDDVLGDLLGDDDDISPKARKPASFGNIGERARGLTTQTSKKNLLEDDFFSKMPLEEGTEAQDSDISDVDPQALLKTLKDMDDMEADLLGIKKSSSGPVQKPAKNVTKAVLSTESGRPLQKTNIAEKGDLVSGLNKDSSSTPTTSRQLKQKSFEDVDDPLAGLLSDEEEGTVKKAHSSATKNTPETNAGILKEKGTSMPTSASAVAPDQKKELTFEDDGDDLMDALGFGENPRAEQKSGRKCEDGEPRPARSMLDELLGRGTAKKLLERPSIGEHKELKLDKKNEKQAEKEDSLGDEFTFGGYQPTVASTPEGRQSRRQSVRFSSENLSELKTDQRSKPSTPASSSPVRSKVGADWLGLKDEDFDLPPSSPPKDSRKSSTRGATVEVPLLPSESEYPTLTSQFPSRPRPVPEAAAQKPEPNDDDGDSWLSNVLTQKKSQIQEKVTEKRPGPSDGVEADSITLTFQHATSAQRHKQSLVQVDKPAMLEEPESPVPRLKSQEKTTPAFPSDSRKGTPYGDTTAVLQGQQDIPRIPKHLQLLPSEPHLVSSPSTAEYEKRLAEVQVQLRESLAGYQAELLIAQTHITALEGQVRRLELEKNQQKMLLESLQQRHQEDLEIIENAHRNRVKVIEESYRQREERIQQENQELTEQYLSRCQSVEQAKSEMLAQHQRQLTELEQERVKEIDRLRELQRMSILEMRKDHEEQLQRLKQLKAQEIDAVTSATSYTRSLNGIIDQMEKFSSSLNDLANKVEATHHTTHQGLEIGARQRNEQLRVLQERLAQQQRDMEDERARLQEVISKMEARLNEQTRLLEQERWRITTEQSKAESLQHSLEEQRRVMTQQLAMERAELERAKEQAELKIKASELRSKEEQLARDREVLEQEKQELRLEKEKVCTAALHIRQRTAEINSMSKLSSQKYEEGEKALLEARRVESEHQAKLHHLQQQMEQLKQQEERLHQERLSLTQQRKQLEQLRMGLPSNPFAFQSVPQMTLPRAEASIISNMHYLPKIKPNNTTACQDLPRLGPADLYAKLVLHKLTADQDHDFLEEEQFFLETLKKASYNNSSQSV